MAWLELKIPPPLVLAITFAAMWGLSLAAALEVPLALRAGAAMLPALAGIALGAIGLWSFARAQTTFDPHRPEEARVLVTTGIYARTRNPMYLGMLALTGAWAVFLSSPLSLAGSVLFALYITRFQIVPEERILTKLFGEQYASYRAKTRRWI